MADAATVYHLDSTPRQAAARLACWWALALAALASAVWLLLELRDGGAVLTALVVFEIFAVAAFWVYAVASFKLIISTARAWCVELREDRVEFRFLDGKKWTADYADIVEVSLHFGDWRCGYDTMELGLGLADGPPGLTGSSRCPGERMERLAAEVRERIFRASGRRFGGAEEDYRQRAAAAPMERRKEKLYLALCLLPALLPAVALVLMMGEDSRLLAGGRTTTGMVTKVERRFRADAVSYRYGEAWDLQLVGSGLLGEGTTLRKGDALKVLYNPESPTRSLPVGFVPRWRRAGSVLFLLPSLAVGVFLCLALRGVFFAYARGRFFFLRGDELVEDRIKSGALNYVR